MSSNRSDDDASSGNNIEPTVAEPLAEGPDRRFQADRRHSDRRRQDGSPAPFQDLFAAPVTPSRPARAYRFRAFGDRRRGRDRRSPPD